MINLPILPEVENALNKLMEEVRIMEALSLIHLELHDKAHVARCDCTVANAYRERAELEARHYTLILDIVKELEYRAEGSSD